jgi:uncharacterized protein
MPPETRRTALYLHGFASSPGSAKVALLKERLAPASLAVEAPDLNVPSFTDLSFEAIASTAAAAIEQLSPAVVIGSSLGSLVALEALRRAGPYPLVLIAPAFDLGERWIDRLPDDGPVEVEHYATGKLEPVRRGFFHEMLDVHPENEPPAGRVTLFIGTDDESVPFRGVVEVWERWEASGRLAAGSKLVIVEGGDHSLLPSITLIAEAAIELASS